MPLYISEAVYYGFLFAPVILCLFAAALWLQYRRWWTHYPCWQEATAHGHRLHMQIERLIRFRWIHRDCKYWVFPVRFDRGPITVKGKANHCLYWSLTYYCFTEVNPSISSASVTLTDGEQYEIQISHDPSHTDSLPLPKTSKHGVLYMRIYEPRAPYPTWLPEVCQNGVLLTGAYPA